MNEHAIPADPNQMLYPAMRYADAHAAIAWLCEAFGFQKNAVYDGPDGTVAHAVLVLDGAAIMLGSARENDAYPVKTPKELGGVSSSIYVYRADPDAHYERARAAGAHIVKAPYDTEYGSREYAVRDLEGYWWSFGTYRP